MDIINKFYNDKIQTDMQIITDIASHCYNKKCLYLD